MGTASPHDTSPPRERQPVGSREPAGAGEHPELKWEDYHAYRGRRLAKLDWLPALVAHASLTSYLSKYRDHISQPQALGVVLFLFLNGLALLCIWWRSARYARWRSVVVAALRLGLCLNPVLSLVVRVAMLSPGPTPASLSTVGSGGSCVAEAAAGAAAAAAPGLGRVAYALAHASQAYALAVLALFYPLPLYWHLPVQLASTLSMAWHNGQFCAAPLLHSPAAQRVFGRVQSALRPLQYAVPLPLLPPTLGDPHSMCSAVVTWIQVFVGLLLPTYIRLRWDLQAMLDYAQARGNSLPAPDRDWESWLCCQGYRMVRWVEASRAHTLAFWLALAGQTWLVCALLN